MITDRRIQQEKFHPVFAGKKITEVVESHSFEACRVFHCLSWCNRYSWCITVNVIRHGNVCTCEYSNVVGTIPDYILVVDDLCVVYQRKDYMV